MSLKVVLVSLLAFATFVMAWTVTGFYQGSAMAGGSLSVQAIHVLRGAQCPVATTVRARCVDSSCGSCTPECFIAAFADALTASNYCVLTEASAANNCGTGCWEVTYNTCGQFCVETSMTCLLGGTGSDDFCVTCDTFGPNLTFILTICDD